MVTCSASASSRCSTWLQSSGSNACVMHESHPSPSVVSKHYRSGGWQLTPSWWFHEFGSVAGSRRRTKRWPSSSGWSSGLWRRSSKSHRVSDAFLARASGRIYGLLLVKRSRLFSTPDPPKVKRQIPEPPPNKPSITKSVAIIKDCCGATQCAVM